MVTRRDVVLGGIATTSLPLLAVAAMKPAAAQREPRYYKVIYDERFPESVAFANRAGARGLAVHAIQGDMTAVWYHDLQPAWKRKPVAIAGMTAHGPLFCLERLAWDFGMRVTMRKPHADGLIAWVIEPGQRT